MTDRTPIDPAERAELDEQDLAIATLIGRYVERRESGGPPSAHDLIAAARELGADAAEKLCAILAVYESMRPAETQPASRIRSSR